MTNHPPFSLSFGDIGEGSRIKLVYQTIVYIVQYTPSPIILFTQCSVYSLGDRFFWLMQA